MFLMPLCGGKTEQKMKANWVNRTWMQEDRQILMEYDSYTINVSCEETKT